MTTSWVFPFVCLFLAFHQENEMNSLRSVGNETTPFKFADSSLMKTKLQTRLLIADSSQNSFFVTVVVKIKKNSEIDFN